MSARSLLTALMLAPLCACGTNAAPNEEAPVALVPTAQRLDDAALTNGQAYSIVPSQRRALCVDVRDNSRDNGAGLQLWTCHAGENQTFVRRGQALQAVGNKCLDLVEGRAVNGQPVQLWDCVDGSPNQAWVSAGKRIQLKGTNMCLNVRDGALQDGGALQVWACNDNDANGQFTFLPSGAGGGSGAAVGSGAQASASGRKLVWQDEFDGDRVDRSKWQYEVNCDGGNNNEWQCYTDSTDTAYVRDGLLHIRVNKGRYKNKEYTSARLNTYSRGDWTYGRFEVRLRVPCGQGFWPAAWMMPSESAYGPWPQSGELDIMEVLGGDPKVLHGTAHFGNLAPNNRSKGGSTTLQNGTFCDDFHVFALERTPQKNTWYLDGREYFSLTPNDGNWSPAPNWPFNKKFFFILNVAMGGNWPGNPDPSIQNGEMLVDYVRVYAPQ
jgi:beta-glucanase (GH16 family)